MKLEPLEKKRRTLGSHQSARMISDTWLTPPHVIARSVAPGLLIWIQPRRSPGHGRPRSGITPSSTTAWRSRGAVGLG